LIRLVKNELVKISHRKGIYILSLIILGILALGVILDKADLGSLIEEQTGELYYTMLEESLKEYDLNDKDEVMWYIDGKVELDLHELLKDLDYSSPLYYYIDNELNSVLTDMYNAKYVNKNDVEYELYKAKYDELVAGLDNYDWKVFVEESKKEVEKQIDTLKASLDIAEEDKDDIQDEIENLSYQLKALNYRLNNDVAPAYHTTSYMVDNYVSSAMSYSSMNKDESTYKDRRELVQNRTLIAEFKEAEYKIENNIVPASDVTLQDHVTTLFIGSDMFIIIAFLIIAGGIIAEEFNKGTIKQLLLRPFTRGKILTSKIIAAVIATFLFACFYYLLDIVDFVILNNEFKSIFDPMIVYNFNTQSIVEYSTLGYTLMNILAVLPEYIMLFAVCIFVGVLTTSTVACVISVFGVNIAGSLLESLLPEKIAAFLPTSCLNFSKYLFGGLSYNKYQTLGGSIAIYVITLVVIVAITFIIFKKKDIKNQ